MKVIPFESVRARFERPHCERHMNCNKVIELLYLQADGELDSSQIGAIRDHVEVCEQCAKYEIYTRRLVQVVRQSVERRGAPKALRVRILQSFEHRRIVS